MEKTLLILKKKLWGSVASKTCPLCRKEKLQYLFVCEGHRYRECKSCGLICPGNSSEAATNRHFYESEYYQNLADILPSLEQARLGVYRKFFLETGASQTQKLLDVGSGCGEFLLLAQQAGWEAYGIEPSPEAYEKARRCGLDRVLCGSLDQADYPKNFFDAITLWNVLDCLPDPVAGLEKIRGWLRPSGVIWIRTPNAAFHHIIYRGYYFFKPILEKMGWKNAPTVFHRSNFRAKTLKRLLQDFGFENIRIQNGILTSGDPYRVFKAGPMEILKKGLYAFAQALYLLSFGRWFAGSVLWVRAVKTGDDVSFSKNQKFKGIKTRLWIKKVLLHGLAVLGYLIGLPLIAKLSGKDRYPRILMYHSVHPHGGDLSVHPRAFEKQMDFLLRHYQPAALKDVGASFMTSSTVGVPAFAVTFDDGYADNYEYAMPILERKKIPATIFVLKPGLQYATHLPEQPLLLTEDQIREMAGRGFQFASHGQSHTRLTRLSPEQAREEILFSKKEIEKVTGQPVNFFAYPYGRKSDFNKAIQSLVRQAGYQAAFSAEFGTSGKRASLFALKRMGIEAADTLFTLQAKMNGALDLLSLLDFSPLRKAMELLDRYGFKMKPANSEEEKQKTEKILLVSVDFPPDPNGVSTIAGALSDELHKKSGCHLRVLAPQMPEAAAFDRLQNYRIHRYPGNTFGYGRFFSVLAGMLAIVLQWRPQCILALNIGYGGLAAWVFSFLYPVQYIVFAYGYEFEKMKKNVVMRSLYCKIYSRAEAVIACSEAVRERLKDFGVPSSKIEVIYPAADPSKFFPVEKAQEFLTRKGLGGRRMIFTAGRLVERKGHAQVLRAMVLLIKEFPNLIYGIAGTGPEEEKLRTLARGLGLESFVHFFGKVADEDLNFLYNACEFFMMPSREIPEKGQVEGFGIVYLEAAACGKASIGGKSGGVAEAVVDGETGFLVDPESVDEIAAKMRLFLIHPEKGVQMGSRAFLRLQQYFGWNRYAKIITGLLKS